MRKLYKILVIAVREFKATALTPAFILSLVFFPIATLGGGAIAGVLAATGTDVKPLEGTIEVLDTTDDSIVAAGLERHFDPENQKSRYEAEKKALEDAQRQAAEEKGLGAVVAEALGDEAAQQFIERVAGVKPPAEVEVKRLASADDLTGAQQRVQSGDVLVAVIAEPQSVDPDLAAEETASESDVAPGEYRIFRRADMDLNDLDGIRSVINRSIDEERYRLGGIDPEALREINRKPLRDRVTVLTERGEETVQNEVLRQLLPLGFAMLLFFASVLGGNYLLMGTLEEKSSRAMEVILSCVSTRELLMGKLIGQGCVGLSMVVVYGTLGVVFAGSFGLLAQLPLNLIPWLLVYFLMAYAFLGSLMLAVGSAVTEIREAQALFAPVTASMIVPMLMMAPVLQDPDSVMARVFSHIPPGVPFVMVARLSQPDTQVPAWEMVTTTLAGFAGVAIALWIAAKIFRIGVLMYGKPPSLLGLLKMLRYD